MGRFVAGDAPEVDRLVGTAIASLGESIAAMRIPRLAGVVLGGGYGRGEGGARKLPGGAYALSNDLDFHVVAEDGSTRRELAAIDAALRPLSEEWTRRLGVDVDFCTAKTPWRLRHDSSRLMVQELLHGYADVALGKGESLFAAVPRLEPGDLPGMEAARLLMNRGAGLLLSLEGAPADFVARNINKAALGAGDARLIARGAYMWRAEDRARELDSPLYTAALEWKFRPRQEPVCGWCEARDEWLGAEAELRSLRARELGRRSLREAARWIARRRTLGDPASLGLDPVARTLAGIGPNLKARRPMSAGLRRDWEIFS
ncbi:MAG: hypothetical protein K6F50_05495 [Kiritimatiellae bacterium]|nr:hypothetical protein [Kiritimatiellia bacterium]